MTMKWKLPMTRTCICVGSFGLANSQHKTPEKYEIESNRTSSSSEEENRVSLSLRKKFQNHFVTVLRFPYGPRDSAQSGLELADPSP